MTAVDRAIDNRAEELLEELGEIARAATHLQERIEEEGPDGCLPSDWPILTTRAQRLFWEWRTLIEHKRYGCPS
jgi:hypothetical protein